MKKLVYLFLAFTLFACSGDDEETLLDCPDCFISVSSQEDIDNLPLYKSVYTLHISSSIYGKPITNFDRLSQLESVSWITIAQSTIESLYGLENISGVNGITIDSNPNLTDISPLQNSLSNDNFYLTISDTPVTSLPSIPSNCELCTVQLNNVALENLDNFSNTQNMGVLSIENAPFLNDLSGLDNCANFTHFILENLPQLNGFPVFSNLTSISFLQLTDLPLITNFNGFGNLTAIDYLEISKLNQITSIDGFNNLTTNTSNNSDRVKIRINQNNQLSDFCAITTFTANTFCGLYYDDDGYPVYDYNVYLNAYNPTEAQMESTTECRL